MAVEEVRNRRNEARMQIAGLKEAIARRSLELAGLAKDFVVKLEQKGFADEAMFTGCRMSPPQRQALARQAQELDACGETGTRLKDREEQLARNCS